MPLPTGGRYPGDTVRPLIVSSLYYPSHSRELSRETSRALADGRSSTNSHYFSIFPLPGGTRHIFFLYLAPNAPPDTHRSVTLGKYPLEPKALIPLLLHGILDLTGNYRENNMIFFVFPPTWLTEIPSFQETISVQAASATNGRE